MLKLVVSSCLVVAATAGLLAPVAYTAPLAYGAPLLAPYGLNYRGPLSLAPGQPANILAADGRPLDTLDVNLDRSAHLTARALEGGVHLLKKRSAPLIAPYGHVALTSSLVHTAPLTYNAPLFRPHLAVAPLAPLTHYTHW